MKKLNKLYATLLVLAALGFSGCAHYIPNFETCADMVDEWGMPDGAFCKESNTLKEREIDKLVWDDLIHRYLHISPNDMGKIIKFIEDVCNETKKCKKEEIEVFIYEYKRKRLYFLRNKKHAV